MYVNNSRDLPTIQGSNYVTHGQAGKVMQLKFGSS